MLICIYQKCMFKMAISYIPEYIGALSMYREPILKAVHCIEQNMTNYMYFTREYMREIMLLSKN